MTEWCIVVHPRGYNGQVLTDGDRPVVFRDHGDAVAARDMLVYHSEKLARTIREGGLVLVDMA